jgi:hypothetical protein
MKSLSLLIVPALVGAAGLAFAQQPAPAQSNLDAGGLRPPEAIDSEQQAPPGAPAETPEQELERADKEDSGRGLEWVWLNAEAGGEHVGLQTFKQSDLVDGELIKNAQTGLVFGGGLGARILNWTVGARFRMGAFSDWKLWTLTGEGQFRIPLGRWEPYITAGAGYASLGSFATEAPFASEASAQGFVGRLGFGVDYYLSNTFSVGGTLNGDLLVLSRAAVAGAAASSSAGEAKVYAKDGSGIGAGATLAAVVGLHF